MIETAMIFDIQGNILHWHRPAGRSATYIPDTRELWDILWDTRKYLGGVAHTHPWVGVACPSGTDTTTFRAVEDGLGKHLLWPIVTFSEVGYFGRNPLNREYVPLPEAFADDSHWNHNIEHLRQMSRGDQND